MIYGFICLSKQRFIVEPVKQLNQIVNLKLYNKKLKMILIIFHVSTTKVLN